MTIEVKMIADSISPDKVRLTTLQLRYPRFIHAEFMTHRVFSRNASSSRAVPVKKLIEDIKRDTAMPMHWGKNQKGMQADEENTNDIWYDGTQYSKEDGWYLARDNAIRMAEAFDKAGYHKQIVNRLLEPFSHINVLVTSTEWKNFFHLRWHKDAMPEICELAKQIYDTMYIASSPETTPNPQPLSPGEWHLPYIIEEDRRQAQMLEASIGGMVYDTHTQKILIQCSVARCARVSYLTYEGKPPNVEQDLKLYGQLVGGDPLHASPAEHQGTPDVKLFQSPEKWTHEREWGNFHGWRQYRKMLPNEAMKDR